MKTKLKRIVSTFLSLAMTLCLLAAAPLTVNAANDAFQVTLQPAGRPYKLNEPAVDLKATFEYDQKADLGFLSGNDKIFVQWYCNTINTNNYKHLNAVLLNSESYDYDPSKTITTISTTIKPTTNAVGVKYYFAVITYKEIDYTKPTNDNDRTIEKETATNTARIEVTFDFVVIKEDDNGNCLPGAVFTLTPEGGSGTTSEATSNVNGKANFSVNKEGNYIIREKSAPDGYEGSDEEYFISITPNGVYIGDPKLPDQQLQYDEKNKEQYFVFRNKKKPLSTPTPTPGDDTPGGNTPGGNTPGGNTPGGSTPSSPTPTPAAAITPLPPVSPTPTPGTDAGAQSFRVKKTDADGNLLSGAVFSLIPDSGYTQPAGVKPYEATTANGYASFKPVAGQYILSEKLAPAGYNASDEKYTIRVTKDNVLFVNPATKATSVYEIVTYVNKNIPFLNKEDHFAFMQGYPEGDFRPEKNMTRAEAVVMFSRLLSESMDLKTDHRYGCYPDVEWKNKSMLEPWYANQVCYMHSLGALADYSRDANFRPDDPVTRAEFATLAAHFDHLEYSEKNNFSDVPPSHWAVKYINSAEAKGWITGYPDGTFKPESNITRAEVVTLVGRMLDRFADKAYLAQNFASLPRNYWDFTAEHWAFLMIYEASIGHDYIKDASGEHWTTVYK